MPKKMKGKEKNQNIKWETNPGLNTKSKSQQIRDIHVEINKNKTTKLFSTFSGL